MITLEGFGKDYGEFTAVESIDCKSTLGKRLASSAPTEPARAPRFVSLPHCCEPLADAVKLPDAT